MSDEYEVMIDLYIAITENVGEAAWGADLPSPMAVTFCEPINPLADPEEEARQPKVVTVSIKPESYKPVFEAIYQKMVKNDKYRPYLNLKDKCEAQAKRIEELDSDLRMMNVFVNELGYTIEKTENGLSYKTKEQP